MIDIILAVPFIAWLFLVGSGIAFLAFASKVPRKASGSLFLASLAFTLMLLLVNPVSAPMHDTARKNPVVFYEEPAQAEIVEPSEERRVLLDRNLKPRYDADTQDARNKEMFDALEQADEILKE